jgi:hypothetical protein
MQKNPDLSFAIEESFPLKGTYADALPLGPLMQLRARDDQNVFTAERAQQTLDYWRNKADQIASDSAGVNSPEVLKAHSHDAVAAAHLLAAHDFTAEAEQAYRSATIICPWNPESVNGLADLLLRNGGASEADQLVNDFEQKYPKERSNLERFRTESRAIMEAQPTKP